MLAPSRSAKTRLEVAYLDPICARDPRYVLGDGSHWLSGLGGSAGPGRRGKRARTFKSQHERDNRNQQQPVDLWDINLTLCAGRRLENIERRHHPELNGLP